MNKKGQALIEFVIILPLVIFILLGIVDFMLILSNKSNLESKMNDVVTIYRKDENSLEIVEYLNTDLKNVSFSAKNSNKYTYLEVRMPYKFITPGMDSVFGNKFVIKCERVILNEQ